MRRDRSGGHDAEPEGSRQTRSRRTWTAAVLLVAGVGLTTGVGFVVVSAFNPLADEWHCSPGQAPAHNHAGGSDCFREGSRLPKGYRWDRWGNRPMSYNCDGDGWVKVAKRSDDLADCVRASTSLPPGWRAVDW